MIVGARWRSRGDWAQESSVFGIVGTCVDDVGSSGLKNGVRTAARRVSSSVTRWSAASRFCARDEKRNVTFVQLCEICL